DAEVGEAKPQERPRERSDSLGRDERAAGWSWKAHGLRNEERPKRERRPTSVEELAAHVVQRVQARVQVEDELALGEPGDAPERGGTVARVVERAEHRRRGDGVCGPERVEIGQFDRG